MKAITLNSLHNFKSLQQKFPVITAYDASFSRLIEQAGIETVLVGDSLGNVIQGQESTVPVTMEDMVYHTRIVRRGNSKSFLIADMPFMSYATEEQALVNAAQLMQAGAQMVKLEGGAWLEDSIFLLTERGIPVCGHLGLTPQSVNILGGFRVQGREEQDARRIATEAKLLEEAGIDLLVLECVPSALAKQITESLTIPVIGIGAGPDTDAQVLVLYDILGISPRVPRFAQDFLAQTGSVVAALEAFANAVRNGTFPTAEQGFK